MLLALLETLLQYLQQNRAAVLITVASSLLTGLVTALIVRWITERRARRQATAKEALRACLELRLMLGKWQDAIDEAVRLERHPAETLERLRRFHNAHDYEPRLENALVALRAEPLCRRLCNLAEVFHVKALDSKARIAESLRDFVMREDYERSKDAAIRELTAWYSGFDSELILVAPALQKKAGQSQ